MYLLISPQGDIVLEAETTEALQLKLNPNHYTTRMIRFQAGIKVKEALSPADVRKKLERLEFFNSDGCAKGVTSILPKGTWLEDCVQFSNQATLGKLGAIKIEFPILYSTKNPAIQELTRHYEKQKEVFHVDPDTALSYAADPGLFCYLQNKILDTEGLPFIIQSPTHFMRRFSPNGAHRRREFTMPDIHAIATDGPSAQDNYLALISNGSIAMRQFFCEHWLQFCDIEAEFYSQNQDLPISMAIASKQFTLVKIFDERPRYYAMRSGLVTDAGYGNVMIYNLQWDDTNAKLFNIKTTTNVNPIIIHATLAGGCARVLPALIGQGLASIRPQRLPYFLMEYPLVLVAINKEAKDFCDQLKCELSTKGIYVDIILSINNLSKTIKKLIDNWQLYYAVVGEKEYKSKSVNIQCSTNDESFSLDEWILLNGDILRQYCPPHISPTTKKIPIVPSYLAKELNHPIAQGLFDKKKPAAEAEKKDEKLDDKTCNTTTPSSA